MNWMDFVTGIFVGVGIVAPALKGAAKRFGRWLLASRKTDKPIPPPQYDPKDVALNRGTASKWNSLPGGRIELGSTGFYITFNPAETRKVYEGFTPEHLCIVFGPHLADMKRYLEDEASQRAEFDPPEGGWQL